MFIEFWTAIRKLRELQRNQRMSRAALEAWKLQKFRRLVRHVGQSSPYYAQLIQERGIAADSARPEDFPVLTKAVLMTNFDRIVTDRRLTKEGIAQFLSRSTDPNELFLDEFRVLHTSGSSGEVGYFVYSKRDWSRATVQNRRSSAADLAMPKGRRLRMAFYGATGGHYAGVTMALAGKRGPSRLFVACEAFEVNSPLANVVAGLNAFQPDFLMGYTAALRMLGQQQREGALRIAPLRLSAGGETVTESDRSDLEAAFGCPVVNTYACTEHLVMGASTAGADMTLYDDDLIYEFHDDHSLITNLFNETLPLIRYRMSDVLRPLPRQEGDSPYIKVSSLVGRSEIMPMFINEAGAQDFISPHTINEIFVAGITRFQMHLLDSATFRFLVCLDPSLADEQQAAALRGVGDRLDAILAQKSMRNVSYDVRAVDAIALNERTRKFQLIVDRRGAVPN